MHQVGGPHLLHREGEPINDDALAALVAEVRASVVRRASTALDAITTSVPAPILSVSVRRWPSNFPSDIAVLRQAPWESRADSVMYCQVLAEVATQRGLDVFVYDAKTVELEAGRTLGIGAHNVLHGPRATLGAPWSKDHRTALAATVVALG